MASPAFRSFGADGAGVANTSTVTAPVGIIDNDILLCHVYREFASNEAITWPTGFTGFYAATQTGSNPDVQHNMAWKRAASESGDYALSWASACYREAIVSCWSGCILSGDPWDQLGASSSNGSQSTEIVVTGVTTTVVDTLIVVACASFSGAAWTEPSGMAERVQSSVFGVFDLAQAAAGATGDKTATTNNSWHNGVMIALRSAAASTAVKDIIGMGVVPWAR